MERHIFLLEIFENRCEESYEKIRVAALKNHTPKKKKHAKSRENFGVLSANVTITKHIVSDVYLTHLFIVYSKHHTPSKVGTKEDPKNGTWNRVKKQQVWYMSSFVGSVPNKYIPCEVVI